jgi:hypothetical protein
MQFFKKNRRGCQVNVFQVEELCRVSVCAPCIGQLLHGCIILSAPDQHVHVPRPNRGNDDPAQKLLSLHLALHGREISDDLFAFAAACRHVHPDTKHNRTKARSRLQVGYMRGGNGK